MDFREYWIQRLKGGVGLSTDYWVSPLHISAFLSLAREGPGPLTWGKIAASALQPQTSSKEIVIQKEEKWASPSTCILNL